MERKPSRGRRAPVKPKEPEELLDEEASEIPDLLDEDAVDDLDDDDDVDEADADLFADDDFAETNPKQALPPVTEDVEEGEAIGAEAVGLTSDLPIQVVAVLGKKTISMRDLLNMRMGEVIDLGRAPSEVVDLVANGKLVAKGELIEIDGKLGVRIIKMVK